MLPGPQQATPARPGRAGRREWGGGSGEAGGSILSVMALLRSLTGLEEGQGRHCLFRRGRRGALRLRIGGSGDSANEKSGAAPGSKYVPPGGRRRLDLGSTVTTATACTRSNRS